MKYILTIIIILLIILYCMGCVAINKETNIYITNPTVSIEAEIKCLK